MQLFWGRIRGATFPLPEGSTKPTALRRLPPSWARKVELSGYDGSNGFSHGSWIVDIFYSDDLALSNTTGDCHASPPGDDLEEAPGLGNGDNPEHWYLPDVQPQESVHMDHSPVADGVNFSTERTSPAWELVTPPAGSLHLQRLASPVWTYRQSTPVPPAALHRTNPGHRPGCASAGSYVGQCSRIRPCGGGTPYSNLR